MDGTAVTARDWLAHSFAPAMPRQALRLTLLSGLGAGLCLIVTGFVLALAGPGQGQSVLAHPLLIAPFGATTFLIFAVPSSPMAQPWSSLVGNGLAAVAAILLLRTGLPVLLTAAAAVGVAVVAMGLLRAMHPPAGAVALATVLSAHPDNLPSLGYLGLTVLLGTASLVACGMLWNPATGRTYPFRQPVDAPHPHGTADKVPERRFAPSPDVLASALNRLRLASNLGVEDLARLIEITENESAARSAGPMNAQRIMSRDLVTVPADALLPTLAQEFLQHRFKSLPIRNPDGSFGGLVPQSALIGRADPLLTAAALADPRIASAGPEASLSELMGLLADGHHQQSVPIVDQGRLQGLVTRSDLISALSAHLRDRG